MAFRRFAGLKARGIVNNRASLRNLILKHGFPPGRLIGPNSRGWTDEEVDDWVASRPVAPRAGNLPPPRKRGPKPAPAATPDAQMLPSDQQLIASRQLESSS